ncbi:hypothetical protein [Clostridium psychrophilum]|uniref:hypothetical protein n=1 Tax=Clostridium psychrophilum TaxID=132926 RepID=UPI001C0B46F6|nr:hypothetical protein [Clostridium psychrophilum]MBU3182887.1 hypothetical protein [Clostridium psychrophilum]
MSKDSKQWLKVIEIASLIGLSKVTVYKKLKAIDSKVLRPLLKIEQGIQYYDIKILDLLQPEQHCDSVNDNTYNLHSINSTSIPLNDYVAMDSENINLKTDYISTLKDQLNKKDIQIQDLNKRLSQEQELHQNTQILFKQQQPKQILQLEAHFEELDNKLIEIKDKMQKKEKDHKGIFKKIFSK